MFRPVTISTQIEISASPATVRSVFLDFARIKRCTGWKIEIKSSDKQEFELKKGDRLNVDIEGFAFSPSLLENSTERFSWDGSIPGLGFILSGKHYFSFLPSKENPGGTTFTQTENFTGAVTVLWPGPSTRKWSIEKWDEFNEALKKEIERSSS